jgi:serine/threonine-protein kinase
VGDTTDTEVLAKRLGRGTHPLLRSAVFGGGAALVGGAGFLVWSQFIDQPLRTGKNPPVDTSAVPSANPSVDTSTTASSARPPVAEAPMPSWMNLVREGQQAIASGDLKQANKLLKDAFDKGAGHGVPRVMLEHLGVATAKDSAGACRLTGLGRPRSYDLSSASARVVPAGRPTIVMGTKGPVVSWTDTHDGSEHAYTVTLDDALRDVGSPVDVTPEGISVQRPELDRAGDKLVLTYSDGKGAEAGVHARFLDGEGRIAGPSVQVTPPKVGSFWPSLAPAPDGSFWVAWTDEVDNNSEDLFLRHLGPALEVMGDVVRATDFVPAGPTKPRARFPSLGIAGTSLFVAFRLERDPLRLIQSLRVPLADAGKGLLPKRGDPRDRNIGELSLVNTDKSKADTPVLSCGGGGCFVTWHAEQGGGAWVAYVEQTSAQPMLRRHFAKTGSRPVVGVAPGGQALAAWYETGKILTAPITRDTVGTAAKIARVSGDQPTPSLVAGSKPGEWYLSWLDYETGHLEPYVARVQCK